MIPPDAARIALDLLATREAGTVVTPAQLQREVCYLQGTPPVGTSHPWRTFLARCARAGRVRGLGQYQYVTV